MLQISIQTTTTGFLKNKSKLEEEGEEKKKSTVAFILWENVSNGALFHTNSKRARKRIYIEKKETLCKPL